MKDFVPYRTYFLDSIRFEGFSAVIKHSVSALQMCFCLLFEALRSNYWLKP